MVSHWNVMLCIFLYRSVDGCVRKYDIRMGTLLVDNVKRELLSYNYTDIQYVHELRKFTRQFLYLRRNLFC